MLGCTQTEIRTVLGLDENSQAKADDYIEKETSFIIIEPPHSKHNIR